MNVESRRFVTVDGNEAADVTAGRPAGWAKLAAASVREAQDLAIIAHAATLRARVPFMHFFDGFRTSHEVMKIERVGEDDLRAMIDDNLVRAHRLRGLTPDHPVVRGTAHNPDTFFQARETSNPFYAACVDIVQTEMDRFAALVGRQYHLFDYTGAPNAEHVVVVMGSGGETVEETVQAPNARGDRVGVLKVRLYRPFAADRLIAALPATVTSIAVLDRTKEPGSAGEPLFQDVVTAIHEAGLHTRVIGGRGHRVALLVRGADRVRR